MSTSRIDFDIIIVGAGPTGLTLANLLGQDGIRTLVVERNETTSDIPKAVALDDEGMRTIAAVGLAEAVHGHTLTATGSKYYDADGRLFGEVGSGVEEFGYPKRNYFHQPELERILCAGLAPHDSVTVGFSTVLERFEQDATGVSVTVGVASGAATTLRSRFLVGADGGRSAIRTALGVDFSGETYAQDWIVLDTVDDPMGGNFSRFICDPARPVAIIPAPNGGRRYEFMLMPGESPEEMLSPEMLEQLLRPYRPYVEAEILRDAVYTFHARIADRWRRDNVFLAGDAAHLTPPFAGQGMNAGLRDAHNLSWKLGMVLRGEAGEHILDSYQLERHDPCWAMIMLAVVMGEIVMPATPEQVAARDTLAQRLADFPGAQDYFLGMKFKPRPRYAQGLFVESDPVPLPGSLLGSMIPNPAIEDADGRRALLDDALGPGFAIISQDDAGAGEAARMMQGPILRLAPRHIHLAWTAEPAARSTATTARIVDPMIAAPLRAHRDQILLLRPDRYVAGAFEPAESARFIEAFTTALGGEGSDPKRKSA